MFLSATRRNSGSYSIPETGVAVVFSIGVVFVLLIVEVVVKGAI